MAACFLPALGAGHQWALSQWHGSHDPSPSCVPAQLPLAHADRLCPRLAALGNGRHVALRTGVRAVAPLRPARSPPGGGPALPASPQGSGNT